MSLLDRFRHHATAVEGSQAEHEAFVELLVAAAFADGAITTAELTSIERFDEGHADWDTVGWSVLQHLPVAIAKVRGGADVADIAARITTPALRATAVTAVEDLTRSDGESGGDTAFLAQVRSALA